MAQETSRTPDRMLASNVALANPAASNNVLLDLPVAGLEHLSVAITPATRDLDALIVQAQFHPSAPFVQLTNAVTATPAGYILAASGTLASLAAAATGWFLMDVRGLYSVRVLVSGTTDNTGTVTAYAGAA